MLPPPMYFWPEEDSACYRTRSYRNCRAREARLLYILDIFAQFVILGYCATAQRVEGVQLAEKVWLRRE
jgi:hypothetical protein